MQVLQTMATSLSKDKKVLLQCTIGEENKITKIHDLLMAKRLFAMGLLPGSTITLIRQGFFSKTCYVKSGIITLALRKEEAAVIEVE